MPPFWRFEPGRAGAMSKVPIIMRGGKARNMLPRYIPGTAAISVLLTFTCVLCTPAQPAEINPSQDMAMAALSDICAKEMPDVAKVETLARKRWKGPQKLKGMDQWSVEAPGEGTFSLAVGKQDAGQTCTVTFSGNAADAMLLIEQRFKLTRSQVHQGKRIWMLTLNGRPGMVFIEDHPASRLNLNVGIHLDDAAPADATNRAPGARARKQPTSATP